MPPRSQPTERQRRLGAELKKLRLAAGLPGDKAAAIIDADRQRISNIEAGRVDVPRNGLYQLLRAYNCPEGPLFEGLMAMAQDRGRGWWDEYRDIVGQQAFDLAELESRSDFIKAHEPLLIPGMLQTADYARAVCITAGDREDSIEDYVDFRMSRQRILQGNEGTGYHAVVHEAALRTRVGSAATMRAQLQHLTELASQHNVTIQIFPFDAGAYSAFSRSFSIFGGTAPELDTVRLEQPVSNTVHHDQEHMQRYREIFRRLTTLALAPVDSNARPASHEGRGSLGLIEDLLDRL